MAPEFLGSFLSEKCSPVVEPCRYLGKSASLPHGYLMPTKSTVITIQSPMNASRRAADHSLFSITWIEDKKSDRASLSLSTLDQMAQKGNLFSHFMVINVTSPASVVQMARRLHWCHRGQVATAVCRAPLGRTL